MMKKHLLLSALILPAAMAFTSCMNTEGNRQESTINYGGSLCFNYVTDLDDPARSFISLSPQYSFQIEYFSSTLTTSMSNVRLTSDGSPLTFRTPAMKASNANTNYTISCTGTDIVPEGQSQSYVFSNFNLNIIERSILNASGSYKYSPVYNLTYTVNNRYKVRVFPTYYDVVGTITSTAPGATTSSDSKRAIVSLTLNPDASAPTTGKATLELIDITFANDFTEPRIIAEGIPYTVSASGISIRTDNDAVYKIKDVTGKEIAGAGLSDIIISIDVPSGSTSLSLHANVTGLQGENAAVDYNLAGSLSYYYNTTSN